MYDIAHTFMASTVEQALELLAAHPGATLISGGTDVLIRMKERKLREATLVSLMDVRELRGVRMGADGAISIGAGTCFADIAQNPIILEHCPVLALAAEQVGSPQIRNVATIGGNICNGAVSADSVPALYVLDAQLEIAGLGGKRTAPICGFHTGPGKTALREGELLAAVVIPLESYAGYGSHYIKFGQRNAMEIATLDCAASVKLTADKMELADVRISFGVAAPTPIRCPQTEKALAGRRADRETMEALRESVLAEVSPRESWRASKELRLQLIRELSVRATAEAIRNAGGDVCD